MRTETPQIYNDLQRKLMSAALPPGERLKLTELQDDYGCSANTVRDVLLQLSKVGLVEFELQRGFRVCEATQQRRRDLTQLRILLEQEGARLSIQQAELEWEAELSAAHHKLSHIESQMKSPAAAQALMEIWIESDFGFHDTLIAKCGNVALRSNYRNVYMQFRQQIGAKIHEFGMPYYTAIVEEHGAILRAALIRDAGLCQAAIHTHLARHL